MKLRFGIDPAARERIRRKLDALCTAPSVGRRLAYVYLDTPDGALAAHGVALRFRRTIALGPTVSVGQWKRQEIWPDTVQEDDMSLKTLGIKRLKQRLDATFSVRIERWTWTTNDGAAALSLDSGTVSTGTASEAFEELRIVCRRRDEDAAMRSAVELGATHLALRRPRERGLALVQGMRSAPV